MDRVVRPGYDASAVLIGEAPMLDRNSVKIVVGNLRSDGRGWQGSRCTD